MLSCGCLPCALSCEPRECDRYASHPETWRAQLSELVATWHDAHRASVELDAADAALDLGLVDLGFTGADLHAIAAELVMLQRELYREGEALSAVVTYSHGGERMGARCPCCLAPVERRSCDAELKRGPISIELALRLSTADGANEGEAA